MTETVTQVAVFIAPPNGVPVLRESFRSLQGGFPGSIVILLHPGTGRERSIADNLNVASNLMVLPGLDGVKLRNRRAYVVAAGTGLIIGADGSLTRAYGTQADPRSEPFLASVASRYRAGAFAIALTALDETEREGFDRVRAAGGQTLALDKSDRLWADSSGPRVVPMPADELLSTSALGPRILEIARSTTTAV